MKIHPRLNYNFKTKDLICSLAHMNKRELFEDEVTTSLKQFFDDRNIYYFNHARTALRVLLSSFDKRLRVGVMGYNCLTVIKAIREANCESVFIDIDLDLQISLVDLDRKRANIDILILTNLFGIPQRNITYIKKKYPSLLIIEDCSHAFLSVCDTHVVGLISDFSIFSFGMAKFPSVNHGGFLLVNNITYLNQITSAQLLMAKPTMKQELKMLTMAYCTCILAYPFFYGNFTKPILRKIESKYDITGKYKLQESYAYSSSLYLLNERLKYVVRDYNIQLQNIQRLNQAIPSKNRININGSNGFMLPIRVDNRKSMIADFEKQGYEIGKHFSTFPIHAKNFGYEDGMCPNSETISTKLVTIPTYHTLHQADVDKLYFLLIKYFKNEA